jgi:hypothetical protein
MVSRQAVKLLFVDHRLHQKTRSSDFFLEIIDGFFDIEIRYIDERCANIEDFDAGDADVVVLWQMDYLAPIFIAQEIPTVSIPMFDGTGGMPDIHWEVSSYARFVNFCRTLDSRQRRLGLDTFLVKYFPEPSPIYEPREFDTLRAFLWQRRPEHGVNLQMIERMLGGQLSSVHIHDAPDDETLDTAPYLTRGRDDYSLTTSRWFDDRSEYDRVLSECNVFFAPRRGEGIGMAMLEAMERGMVVIVSDAPTHNEYVANWINGILVDPDSSGPFHLSNPAFLGAMARRSVIEGRAAWLEAAPRLIDFIRTTPRPPSLGVSPDTFGLPLCKAFERGPEHYHAWLRRQGTLVGAMSGKIAAARGGAKPSKARKPVVAWLDQNRIDFKIDDAERFVSEGELAQARGVSWMVSQSLKLEFRVDPTNGATTRLRLRYRLDRDISTPAHLCAILNGWTLGVWPLQEDAGEIEAYLDVSKLRIDNELHFQTDLTPLPIDNHVSGCLGLEKLELL